MFRRGGYRRKFGQRFGIYERNLRERLKTRRVVWVHAVSVGEVAIGLKLIRKFCSLNPAARFVLTTTTTTGFAFAEKNAPPEIEVLYSPLDFWPIMKRAFAVIKPERILLVEAEVWPNLVAQARAGNVPIALVNARLSPRSERRFRKFRWLVAPLFRQLDLVCVPEARDVDRWSALGVDRGRIHHTGSIKYDPVGTEETSVDTKTVTNQDLYANANRLVLFGGSTHRGEEEILARVFLSLRQDFPELLLFLAPRHVERAKQIRRELQKISLGVEFCSEIEAGSGAHPDCLVLDRTGELRKWYQVASVVFVGKSLAAIGGQNPVEPILAGKPVVFGPHMENFATLARELIANRAAVEVSGEDSLRVAVHQLLSDEKARNQLVGNARRVIDSHRGATDRTAKLVINLSKTD